MMDVAGKRLDDSFYLFEQKNEDENVINHRDRMGEYLSRSCRFEKRWKRMGCEK